MWWPLNPSFPPVSVPSECAFWWDPQLRRSTCLISPWHNAIPLFPPWPLPGDNRNTWQAIPTVALELPCGINTPALLQGTSDLVAKASLSNRQADLWWLLLCKSSGWHLCEGQFDVHHLISGMRFWVEFFKTKMDSSHRKIRPRSLQSDYIMIWG